MYNGGKWRTREAEGRGYGGQWKLQMAKERKNERIYDGYEVKFDWLENGRLKAEF